MSDPREVEDAKHLADSQREESEARSTIHTDEAEARLASEIHVLREAVEELTDRHEAQDELLRRKQTLISEAKRGAKRAFITAVASVVALMATVGLAAAWVHTQNTTGKLDRALDRIEANQLVIQDIQARTSNEAFCPQTQLLILAAKAGAANPDNADRPEQLEFLKRATAELQRIYTDVLGCQP